MLRTVFAIALIAALPACRDKAADNAPPTAEAGAPVKAIDRTQKGKPAPATTFHDPAGKDITLAQFRGRPLLVNLWASWCAPCVKELPTLDRLATHGGTLQLVAISEDSGPPASVAAFLKANHIVNLKAYHDPAMAMSGALGAETLPTSILFDADGREVWRFVGERDWTAADVASQLAEAGAAPPG